ncbi:hypothetical protein HZS_3717, partial [Henneguya salminicola]
MIKYPCACPAIMAADSLNGIEIMAKYEGVTAPVFEKRTHAAYASNLMESDQDDLDNQDDYDFLNLLSQDLESDDFIRYRNPELNYLIDIQDIYIEKLHQLQ